MPSSRPEKGGAVSTVLARMRAVEICRAAACRGRQSGLGLAGLISQGVCEKRAISGGHAILAGRGLVLLTCIIAA